MSEDVRKSAPLLLDSVSERRRYSRRFAESTFVAGSLAGRLVDVSESGLGLEAPKPFPVLQRGTFTLGIGRAKPQFFSPPRAGSRP